IYRDSVLTSQTSLSSSTPPSPSANAVQSWSDDAQYISSSTTSETVWIIGFLFVPKTATFTFTLQTNGSSALFLSTNDTRANQVKIADSSSLESSAIILQNNTNYYFQAIGSRSGGGLQLSVQARMHETLLTGTTSSLVQNEIQNINVSASVTPAHQVRLQKHLRIHT
ncbi:unnamed protein product, partial [Didymodactylos carnosus]